MRDESRSKLKENFIGLVGLITKASIRQPTRERSRREGKKGSGEEVMQRRESVRGG